MVPLEFDDIHPILQEYYYSLEATAFIALIGYVRSWGNTPSNADFVRDICRGRLMSRECEECNINPMRLADLILEYSDIQITENDIEYYLPHCGCD